MIALGQLAGGVSHEMNNMLTVVLSGVSAAISSLAPDHPAVAELAGVTAAAEHSHVLARQLVTFSQKQSVRLVHRELWGAVHRRTSRLQHRLGPSIEIELEPQTTPAHVAFDPRQLGVVLEELAANAAAAMPDGGRLRLSIKSDPSAERPSALLVVQDTGMGMSAATIQRALEPFFTTQTFGHGAGMGLSIVYGIVHAMDGDITLSSEVGGGTTVTIRLPTVPAPSTAADTATQQPGDPQAGSMLVVCQDHLVRRVLGRMLRREARQVVDAKSLTEASALLKSADPDLDLMVVEINSNKRASQTLSWVHSNRRPGLGIINVVGPQVSEAVQERLRSCGELLGKPFTVADLRQAMHRARSSVAQRDP